ncbi:MAG TPA: helix-turn-helix domain-containing protein [Marmoricola sp.]|nr:helix-turn-helix domain-containing protein [Marmoricola sp.]
MPDKPDSAELARRTTARVAEVANTMGEGLTELSRTLHQELADSIPELRGDPLILELLRASVESNVETFLHATQHDIAIEDLTVPPAAVEYARRLAQRGISSNALLRAYRLGQQRVLDWALAEIGREESDDRVAFAAARALHSRAFGYVDRVSEQVVAEYEAERERWLANRNTLRATMLGQLLDGVDVDLAAAEQALGYRLRQNHLGVVLWSAEPDGSTVELRRLEALLAAVAGALGAGTPLFIPQDHSVGWGWIPLGRSNPDVDVSLVRRLVDDAGSALRVAVGTPASAGPGFRSTHLEAQRAHLVATIAADRALAVTTYADPGVRAAALLAGNVDLTRDLVRSALGPLAADDEGAERLRETLLAFLTEKGSYVATADVVHLHKNTVKYRVDKAVEARGRPLDDDRFNLELALIACRWLGRAVLPS